MGMAEDGKFPKMENMMEQYEEIKRNDAGFPVRENNFDAQSTDQVPDCWTELWETIKDKGSRFLDRGR